MEKYLNCCTCGIYSYCVNRFCRRKPKFVKFRVKGEKAPLLSDIPNITNLSVPSYSVEKNPETQDSFVSFLINVETSKRSWKVTRSYLNFSYLHQQLGVFIKPLPKFPKNRWFRTLEPSFLDSQKCGLEIYLRELLEIPEVAKNRIFTSFLGDQTDDALALSTFDWGSRTGSFEVSW